MNKEQLFCLIGELDDRFLEKYRQMDLYLSQRAYRKKRTLRILAIAACLALVIGACVPVGMMATPAGNAVLTEQLNRIDGFRPWQESVAEKLEQSLSGPAWKLLQTTPILNVLTQSQYPDYAFKSMQYGAYLDEPEYLIYNVSSKGGFFPDEENFSFDRTEYRDPDAAPYYELSFGQPSSEITLSLPYVLSLTASLQSQAVHMYYQVQEDGTEYYAFVDAQTGACVCKEYFGASEQPSAFVLTEQEMLDAAYEVLASNVRDPEAYTPSIYEQSGFYYCEYIRYVGDRKSCDRAIIRFDRAGDMRSIKFSYLGAMRNTQEVPQQMIDQINAYMEQLCEECVGTSTQDVGQVVVLPDGRLALQCYLQVYYWGTGWNTGLQHDDMYFMACLTESVPGYGELAGTQDAEALTTEPPETSPNTTEPDTTEPDLLGTSIIPDLVEMRYLAIGVRDESGEVTPLLSAEELENFDRKLELEYVKGGELIVECYAAYDRSGAVDYECQAKNGIAEQIAFSDIDTDLTVDVQADYVHFLRFTIPLDDVPFGQSSVALVGHATDVLIDGWAMMVFLELQLNEPAVSPPVIDRPYYEPPVGDDTTDDSGPAAVPQLIEMGYLAVCARDENGETRRLLDTQELNGFTGELTVQYLLGEELIIDLYVALEDSDQVSYTCDKGTVHIVDFSEIDTNVAVNVQADYVKCLRLTVPMSELTRGTNYVVVYGNATRVQIDGWVLLETIMVNIS